MKHPPQHRLKTLSRDAAGSSHPNPRCFDVAFDPWRRRGQLDEANQVQTDADKRRFPLLWTQHRRRHFIALEQHQAQGREKKLILASWRPRPTMRFRSVYRMFS
jgi:hypothetical protein